MANAEPEVERTTYRTVQGPPLLNNSKSFESWKTEVELWLEITDIKPEKVAIMLALSLPNVSKFGNDIKDTVLENVSREDMKKTDGHKFILDFLQKELGKNLTVDKFDRFKDFVFCKKTEEQEMEEYIRDFDSKVNRLVAVGQKMEGDIVTFMLLLNSNLQRWELSLVMSALNFDDKKGVYEAAKKQMKQMLGKHVSSTGITNFEGSIKT